MAHLVHIPVVVPQKSQFRPQGMQVWLIDTPTAQKRTQKLFYKEKVGAQVWQFVAEVQVAHSEGQVKHIVEFM